MTLQETIEFLEAQLPQKRSLLEFQRRQTDTTEKDIGNIEEVITHLRASRGITESKKPRSAKANDAPQPNQGTPGGEE